MFISNIDIVVIDHLLEQLNWSKSNWKTNHGPHQIKNGTYGRPNPKNEPNMKPKVCQTKTK